MTQVTDNSVLVLMLIRTWIQELFKGFLSLQSQAKTELRPVKIEAFIKL